MKKRYWTLLSILILGITGFIYTKQSQKEDDAKNEEKRFAKPEIKTIENKQLISGRLSSSKEVNIKSELAGIINALYVGVGDHVKKGQAIAKIRTLPDPRSTQDAQRQVELAKINLNRIKSNYNRTKSLYDKEVVAKQEFEIAEQEYKTALTELSTAQNYLKIVKQGFSNKSDFVSNVIYSTIDGIVLDVPVKIGGSIQNRNTFSEGTTIATISDDTEYIFKGQVNEKDLKHIHLGKELSINVNALKGESYSAHITKVAPKGVDVSGITRFDIEAKLSLNESEITQIKSGFTATAEFLLERASNVLSIPEKYIQYNLDTAYIYVKKGDDKEKKILEMGVSDGQFIEIKSGLNKKDLIYKETIEE